MQVDNTTLYDLNLMHADDQLNLFHHFNLTHTVQGASRLQHHWLHPFSNTQDIIAVQEIIQALLPQVQQWPKHITNGTLMVVSQFYESSIAHLPATVNLLEAYTYRYLNYSDYALVRFSVQQLCQLVIGFQEIIQLLPPAQQPAALSTLLQQAKQIIEKITIPNIRIPEDSKPLSLLETVRWGSYFWRNFRNGAIELIEIYAQLDAWLSMAKAVQRFHLQFPIIQESDIPFFKAEGLYHPLLAQPTAYDFELDPDKHFLFLTGANMAGKSTFIKSIGIANYLAHLGMGVPAAHLQLSRFDGMLSNIQVQDNILKGESFFFNEVQRVKKTIVQVSDGKKWLVLIDELFKGTNVQDAMRCSTVVIEGLRKIPNALFVLSSHLYEIGDELSIHPNIVFRYFETTVEGDEIKFSYQLKKGISKDRLGYLILKKEGVLKILENL